MSENMHGATARVTITLEVTPGSNWGSNCSISQVHEQAGVEATNHVRKLIQSDRSIRIIGDPKVSVVVVERAP